MGNLVLTRQNGERITILDEVTGESFTFTIRKKKEGDSFQLVFHDVSRRFRILRSELQIRNPPPSS